LRVPRSRPRQRRRSMPRGKTKALCIMKIIVLSILIFVSVIFCYGQTNSWQNLTPLLSTRTDVERLLGKPKEDKNFCCRYETLKEQISVHYATGKCKEGWNIQKDTLLSLTVSPNSGVALSFDELKLNRNEFSLSADDAFHGTWTNAEQGLQYHFSNIDRELRSITYLPKKSDNNLRCNGFPAFLPEGQHYPFERFSFHNQNLNRKDNLNRIYARLDTFIIQAIESRDSHKGYVLVYFDEKLSLKEYKARLDKIKEHIFKGRNVSAEQIAVIEGGMREEAEVEFYILPKEWKPPAPNPTLPSPQFVK
jgi:hypothetical protein